MLAGLTISLLLFSGTVLANRTAAPATTGLATEVPDRTLFVCFPKRLICVDVSFVREGENGDCGDYSISVVNGYKTKQDKDRPGKYSRGIWYTE